MYLGHQLIQFTAFLGAIKILTSEAIRIKLKCYVLPNLYYFPLIDYNFIDYNLVDSLNESQNLKWLIVETMYEELSSLAGFI
jgi:hypothetical protein